MQSLVKKGSKKPLSEREIGLVLGLVDERINDTGINDTGINQDEQASPNLDLNTRLQQAEARAAQSAQETAQLRETLDAVYNSRSWRLAAPLRAVKDAKTSDKLNRKKKPKAVSKKTGKAETLSPVQYVARDDVSVVGKDLPASLYAFYLPQFHPIAQNDKWWGKGFTEWTNVAPATPLYAGHYQPHEPDPKGGLGYYDLRETSEVMGKQIKLARQYGVEGFCFYFYWFAGERLLETPLLNLLEDSALDVPFCLCWANENWSRRWDGLDDDILMAQDNTPEDDIAFIGYVSKYLKDPRYRRIDGKPLLLVYRPCELPDAKATAQRWRKWCRENGVGEIYLAYTQSFEDVDPRDYGFDGAVEFPPNNSAPPDITDSVTPISPDFAGKVYDWDIFPTRSDNYQTPDYPLFRTVCPAWDNTARRKQGGTVFARSTPQRYGHWLANALRDSVARMPARADRLIFVNAWNEWAEGAHLEPDARYGHGYLAATRDALLSYDKFAPLAPKMLEAGEKKILLVSHDGLRHGAQILALNMARTLKNVFGYEVHMVVLGTGPLLEEYAQLATVHDLSGQDASGQEAQALARTLAGQGIKTAICNTTVSGPFARTLAQNGIHITSLIHELGSVIEQYSLHQHARDIGEIADTIVFPAPLVQATFETITGPLGSRAVLCPQGAYKVNRFRTMAEVKTAKTALRERLGLGRTARIMLGVGYADFRKGFDIFLTLAENSPQDKADIVFVWIGHQEPYVEPVLLARMQGLEASGRLILPGRVDDTDIFYAGADVFVLTSREDPYPSTVLEALDVGLPVVGFDGVTGSTPLIAQHEGLLVPAFDSAAMLSACLRALVTMGDSARLRIATKFRARSDISFRGYVHDLLALSGQSPARVSVVVPNYNYAHYLPARINSIVSQNYPIREIIILDDASSDDSLAVIEQICRDASVPIGVPIRVIINAENSGSVFAQWAKGAAAARGEYVWIAEADDLSAPEFLDAATAGFAHDGVVLSYTQSQQMAEDGTIIDGDYLAYVSDIDASQWRSNYHRAGADETRLGLSIKNSIPNVSAVVFDREVLTQVLNNQMPHIKSYRVAGDWAVYVHMLKHGSVAYDAGALNFHRRHSESVTLSKFGEAELDEIIRMQDYVENQVTVPTAQKQAARAYIKTLQAQFNLNGGG